MRAKNLAAILLLLAVPLPSATLPQNSNNLYLVEKIYVGERGFSSREAGAREKRMNSYLKQELAAAGFVIVEDKNKADAVLSGSQGVAVVADGPQPDPPEHDYEYRLTPAGVEDLWESKGRLWEAEVSIRSKLDEPEVDRMAAPKLVGKLVRAWLKSAKKAGLKTGNKVR